MSDGRKVAVIGGGWAGLAAAVEATRRGARVTLFEMAAQLGGRAREVVIDGYVLDNGQHICLGAYTETLRLLRDLDIAEADAFVRTPLRLIDVNGAGLELGAGSPALAFVRAVLRHRVWGWHEKLGLLRTAAAWFGSGFRCAPELTVAELTRTLPNALRAELIDPLCVAALNTSAAAASAQVFLRVLRDGLFGGSGSSDLLLPRVSLAQAMPVPAAHWLRQAQASILLRRRIDALSPEGDGWRVDGTHFDAAILATSATESARLTASIAPEWARLAASLRHAPIITVYLHCANCELPAPMLALRSDAARPAQFVFDRGQLGGPKGLLAFVISGAEQWVAAGTKATLAATRRQAEVALQSVLNSRLDTVRVVTERRATFLCTPALRRACMRIAPNLCAAGDHVEGPYPSTLEGAVRSGIAAAKSVAR